MRVGGGLLVLSMAVFGLVSVAADAVDDRLKGMSIKELRHLARNLGAADEMPRGVVEKSEVIAALAPIVRFEENRARDRRWREYAMNCLYYGGVLVAIWAFSEPLKAATSDGRAAFWHEFAQRRDLAEYAFRAGSVSSRAAKGCEILNFEGSYLGQFPLVSAHFWTSDHLSSSSRTVNAFSDRIDR